MNVGIMENGVDSIASSPIESSSNIESMPNVQRMFEFFQCIGKIKREIRTGWTHHDINHVESVSDHMYMMAMMTFVIQDQDIDKARCMKMALVHDLAECIVGDITPFCGVSKEEKQKREEDAMAHITQLLPCKDVAKDMMELWIEYGEQKTKEAKMVKDLDRYEMILQAFRYEKDEKRRGELQIFFNTTKGKFNHPQVKSWVEELYTQRERHMSGHTVETLR